MLPAVDGSAEPDRLRGRELPVGALPLPGAAASSRSSSCADAEAHASTAIDERTLLVPVSPRPLQAAEMQDAEAIARRATRSGRCVCSTLPVGRRRCRSSSRRWGVDFAVGGSVKWLCGGPGRGWLYVRPDLLERLEPTFTGWQAHAAPFAFEPELRYADGVARFLTGTPNVPALYAAAPATTDRGDRRRADPRELAAPRPSS